MCKSLCQLNLFNLKAVSKAPLVSVHQAPPEEYILPEISIDAEVSRLIAQNAPVAIGVSGGKDSSVAAIKTFEYLDKVGHKGPRILIHADLGRIEWTMSIQICQELADQLGVELVVVRRQKGDMVDRWYQRWNDNVKRYADLSCVRLIMPWSSAAWRFCTSELKMKIIATELIKRFPGQEILSVIGIRRQESSNRAKKPISQVNKLLTNKTQQTSGLDWNAILNYTEENVWATHHIYKLPIHEAYKIYGSSRVSCSFCVMAREADLLAATNQVKNIPVYLELVELEIASSFGFKENGWLGDIRPDLLTLNQREGLRLAKEKAAKREAIEARIPAHLLYTEGWPEVMPTFEEAQLLASIRLEIAELLGITIGLTTAEEVMLRYTHLYTKRIKSKEAKAQKEHRRMLRLEAKAQKEGLKPSPVRLKKPSKKMPRIKVLTLFTNQN